MSIPKAKIRCVSRYEPLRQLGQGSLTRVYLAALRDEGQRRTELLALKLLRKELAQDDDFRALFLDQAAATLQLQHPNVVRTHDVVADSEACGLSQEFLQGKTLAQLVERLAPVPRGHAGQPRDLPWLHLRVRVLCQVLDALHYVHHLPSHGQAPALVHRDVAPHSVFVTYEGRVKLLGTGFAQTTRALERKLGTLAADIGYAAPELLLGYSAGPSADLYAVGVMLWEAVAGSRRVFGNTREQTIRQRTSGEEPDVEQAFPDAPRPLADICRRALRVSPRHRYATALELKQDLVSYLTSAGGPAEDSLAPSLAALMQANFEAERAEMQLFIDSSLGDAEDYAEPSLGVWSRAEPQREEDDGEWDDDTHVVASDAESDDAWDDDTHIVASDAESDDAWDDDTHIVAADADMASDERADADRDEATHSAAPDVAPSRPSQLSAPDVAQQPNPKRDADTGGHRAFSTSLVQPEVASTRYSRWAVPGSAALLVLVCIVSVTRMSREHQPASARETAALRPPAPSARGTALESPPSRSGLSRSPVGNGPSAAPASGSKQDGAEDTANASGAADAGAVPEAAPTSAFLGAAPDNLEPTRASGSVAPRATEPPQGILPSDLPVVDEDRDRLQQAILAAARAPRPRAASGRGAHDRKLGKAPAKATSQNSAALVPRPIDETDPYEERAAP